MILSAAFAAPSEVLAEGGLTVVNSLGFATKGKGTVWKGIKTLVYQWMHLGDIGMGNKSNSIQSLRGLGFLAVFLYHVGIVPSGGGWGVSLFFILSGFLLMYRSMGREGEKTPSVRNNCRYSINKIAKLYPLHVFMTLVALPFLLHARYGFPGTIGRIVLNLTLLQSWFPQVSIRYSMNNLSWFLSCMMYLYFMYPWMREWLMTLSRGRLIIVGACTALIMFVVGRLVSAAVPRSDQNSLLQGLTYNFPLYRIGDFIIGCCLGAGYYQKEQEKSGERETSKVPDKADKTDKGGSSTFVMFTVLEAVLLIISVTVVLVDWNAVYHIGEQDYLWQKPLLFMIPVIPLIWFFAKSGGVLPNGYQGAQFGSWEI